MYKGRCAVIGKSELYERASIEAAEQKKKKEKKVQRDDRCAFYYYYSFFLLLSLSRESHSHMR